MAIYQYLACYYHITSHVGNYIVTANLK